MKNLIRTYVDPMLEDRLKLLAESSGVSLSSLTAELIQKGLEPDSETLQGQAKNTWLEEVFYLQFLTLQVALTIGTIEHEQFSGLKKQAKQWSHQKYCNLNDQIKED